MNALDPSLCGTLVEAAEAVADEAAENRSSDIKVSLRTQLSQLISVCQSATCHQEIPNYLRYQAGRGIWRRSLVDKVIQALESALEGRSLSDDAKRRAWLQYATYLKRAFVYRLAS